MKSFINVEDLGPLDKAMAEAFEIKNNRYKYQHLGKNKTLMMIFFNNSLRTRLSTQKAAMNLGMNVIVLDVNAGAWKLETERGVIMECAPLLVLLTASMTMQRPFCSSSSSTAASPSLLWRQRRYTPCRPLQTSSPLRNTKR